MNNTLGNYRKVVTLPKGPQVMVRVLTSADRDGLVALFAGTTPEERNYFRDDVTHTQLVVSWTEHIDLQRVIPLVAEVNGRIVGQGTLHRGRGYTRHVAEVRLFVCHEFRGRGVGTVLIQGLVEAARLAGLHHVFILAVSSKTQEIRAFEGLGFRAEGALRDRFMDADGGTYDMLEMALPLKPEDPY